jgi:type IV pilus assembly protein PilA
MKKAFTLIEIIIVIVILGVVATLAIPRMTGTTEQATLSEAVSALESLHAAEKRYELEHPGTYAACAALDVDIVPKNFSAPVCSAASGDVSMTRNGLGYTVTKSIAGVFSCPACPASLRLPN